MLQYKVEKTSYGINCFKVIDNQLHVLMVCKRFTYAFSNFVNGIYASHDNASIVALLNKMTIEEQLDILSLNFQQLWYRLYLNSEMNPRSYFNAKHKYDTAFVIDGGKRIRALMAGCSHVQKLWELPKGRKNSKIECDLHCAIREFCEETSMMKSQFTVLSAPAKSVSYDDADVKYTFKYYLALANSTAAPTIHVTSQQQIGEIQEIKWFRLQDIEHIHCNSASVAYLRRSFNYMKKYING